MTVPPSSQNVLEYEVIYREGGNKKHPVFEMWFLIQHSTRPPSLLQIHCSQIVMMVDL